MKQIFKAVSDIWQKKQRESSAKCTVKVSNDKGHVNQNQILSKKRNKTPNLTSFHSKIHSKTPLHGSTPRLHSITPLDNLHSAMLYTESVELDTNYQNLFIKIKSEWPYFPLYFANLDLLKHQVRNNLNPHSGAAY